MSDVNRTAVPAPMSTVSPSALSEERTRRPRRDAVRRRLLDASLAVFAERGFDSANLDQVAAAAGLTKGAIYSNFASKDELFFAMMTDQVLQRVETIRAALSANAADPHGQQTLHDIGRLLTEAFTTQREWQLVFLDFWRRAVREDAVRARFVVYRRAMRAAIADHVEQIYGGAQVPANFTVDDVVTVVLALCNGLAIEHYIDPNFVSDDLFGRLLARLAGEV
jgi:AcrR family transcriptional regulator